MNFSTVVVPIIYIIFVWWFTTGMIMAVYGRSETVKQLFFLFYTLVAGAAFVGLLISRDNNENLSVYIAITCGILIWGWHVTGYYLGFVTGPRQTHETLKKVNSQRPLNFKDRFMLAFFAGLHHEILALATGVLIAVLTAGHINRWALWIYLTLWVMHGSSRLNVLLGVRNFSIEFLPRRLHYLKHVVSDRKYNEFFPFSVLIASVAVLVLVYQAITPNNDMLHTTGAIMVATMLILGILEHGLLMLPLSKILLGWKVQSIETTSTDKHKFSTAPLYGRGE